MCSKWAGQAWGGGGKGELTTQQKQKKYASHGSCKCSSPEVVVLDEYHVDGYVCCRCGECHDGGAPNMVLDLHCLQCQVMTCGYCSWRNLNISKFCLAFSVSQALSQAFKSVQIMWMWLSLQREPIASTMFVDSMEQCQGRTMQKDEQHLAMIAKVLMYHFCATSFYHPSTLSVYRSSSRA